MSLLVCSDLTTFFGNNRTIYNRTDIPCTLPMYIINRKAYTQQNDEKVLKLAISGLFFVYFWPFQTHNPTFTTNVKDFHPVYGDGIRPHVLLNMSLLA